MLDREKPLDRDDMHFALDVIKRTLTMAHSEMIENPSNLDGPNAVMWLVLDRLDDLCRQIETRGLLAAKNAAAA